MYDRSCQAAYTEPVAVVSFIIYLYHYDHDYPNKSHKIYGKRGKMVKNVAIGQFSHKLTDVPLHLILASSHLA